MRVVHVGNYDRDSHDGVEQTIAGLVQHLPAHAVDVEVWHPTNHVDVLQTRVQDGVTIHDLPVYNKPRGLFVLRRQARDFVQRRTKSVDLFHFHSVFLRQNLKLATLDVPYVTTPHGGYNRRILTGRNRVAKAIWLALWERSFLRTARMIHAVSLPEADEITNLGLRVPVCYIPNGIDAVTLRRASPRPSLCSTFMYLGRLAVDQKGLDLLLRGYAKARAEAKDLPPLTMVGPDFRGGRRQLEDMVRDLGLSDKVVFAGPASGDQKWAMLSQARLFIHTSRSEGMPFALLEAMALGRPVLVTPATNVAKEVAAADAGIVVSADVDAIAVGLRRAADVTNATLDRMGRQSRSMVETKFSWNAIAGDLSRAYKAAVAGTGVSPS